LTPRARAQVEKELQDICLSILDLLDNHMIPSASSGESKVFYLKMKGDYHRYLAEFKTQQDRKESAEHTLLAYKAAQVRVARTRTAPLLRASRGPIGALPCLLSRPRPGARAAGRRALELNSDRMRAASFARLRSRARSGQRGPRPALALDR